jgi:hypothetical protein
MTGRFRSQLVQFHAHAGTGSGRTPHRHQEGVTADTEKTLAGDVYAVVHLPCDADAHHLGVDWPEARLRTHVARPR